jgi:hypothetical protein
MYPNFLDMSIKITLLQNNDNKGISSTECNDKYKDISFIISQLTIVKIMTYIKSKSTHVTLFIQD